jgi:hypothetical protein
MERLLRQFEGGFVGKKARAYSSALIGKEGANLCALVSIADEEKEYHLVHVFRLPAREVSRGVDFDEGEEFRLYSWNGLLSFLNSLHDVGEGFDNLFRITEQACSHRPEFRPVQ